ncbi:extensin-like [Penaeus japonicus]|uniref:extensin-like n=1 Tax=Penaeus japonicus TaxID=27405 RepID=UPI001C710DC2|nr:extensin-like [Penaeus japonicus]
MARHITTPITDDTALTPWYGINDLLKCIASASDSFPWFQTSDSKTPITNAKQTPDPYTWNQTQDPPSHPFTPTPNTRPQIPPLTPDPRPQTPNPKPPLLTPDPRPQTPSPKPPLLTPDLQP